MYKYVFLRWTRDTQKRNIFEPSFPTRLSSDLYHLTCLIFICEYISYVVLWFVLFGVVHVYYDSLDKACLLLKIGFFFFKHI